MNPTDNTNNPNPNQPIVGAMPVADPAAQPMSAAPITPVVDAPAPITPLQQTPVVEQDAPVMGESQPAADQPMVQPLTSNAGIQGGGESGQTPPPTPGF